MSQHYANAMQVITNLKTLGRMTHEDAMMIRLLLELIKPEDICQFEGYELLGFEACDLDWQIVRSRARPLAVLIRTTNPIDYSSDNQESIPLHIAQQVHEGLPTFVTRIVEKFPVLRERFRPILNFAAAIREENSNRLEPVLKSE